MMAYGMVWVVSYAPCELCHNYAHFELCHNCAQWVAPYMCVISFAIMNFVLFCEGHIKVCYTSAYVSSSQLMGMAGDWGGVFLLQKYNALHVLPIWPTSVWLAKKIVEIKGCCWICICIKFCPFLQVTIDAVRLLLMQAAEAADAATYSVCKVWASVSS